MRQRNELLFRGMELIPAATQACDSTGSSGPSPCWRQRRRKTVPATRVIYVVTGGEKGE